MNTTVRTLFRLDPDFIPDGVMPPCREVDPEVFFPIGAGPDAGAAAKAICRRCDLMDDCADWAADTGQRWGIWGALDPVQLAKRRRIRELTR